MGLLLERSDELGQIEAALAEARGGRGSFLVIEGPAGIGKTALLAAARTRGGRGRDARAALARGRARAGVRLRGGASALRAGARGGSRGGARQAAQAAAGAAAGVLGLPGAPPRRAHRVAASTARSRSSTGSTGSARISPPQGRSACAVDDVQRADGPSLRYLAFLLHAARGARRHARRGARPRRGGRGRRAARDRDDRSAPRRRSGSRR